MRIRIAAVGVLLALLVPVAPTASAQTPPLPEEDGGAEEAAAVVALVDPTNLDAVDLTEQADELVSNQGAVEVSLPLDAAGSIGVEYRAGGTRAVGPGTGRGGSGRRQGCI